MIDDELAFEKHMHPNRVCVNYLGKENEKLIGMDGSVRFEYEAREYSV